MQNVHQAQIGHIPRAHAAKLAPFMDDKSLILIGTIAGEKSFYDCPLDVKLLGSSHPVERQQVIDRMRKVRLPLDAEITRKKQEALAKREAKKQMLNGTFESLLLFESVHATQG